MSSFYNFGEKKVIIQQCVKAEQIFPGKYGKKNGYLTGLCNLTSIPVHGATSWNVLLKN